MENLFINPKCNGQEQISLISNNGQLELQIPQCPQGTVVNRIINKNVTEKNNKNSNNANEDLIISSEGLSVNSIEVGSLSVGTQSKSSVLTVAGNSRQAPLQIEASSELLNQAPKWIF